MTASIGKPVRIALTLLGAAILGVAFAYLFKVTAPPPAPRTDSTPASAPAVAPSEPAPVRLKRQKVTPEVREMPVWETPPSRVETPARQPAPQNRPATSTPPQPVVASPVSNQLFARLSQLTLNRNSLSARDADEVNQLFRQLVDQGAGSVPAIRSFLEKNEDVDFDAISGGNLVNYPSLRLGLLDALQQIGGPEAVELASQTLRTTGDPLELAILTRMLEELAPEQYRQQELAAARETLAMASSGQLPGRDLSSLFELLQKYGDSSIAPDLQNAAKTWNYYATLALAGLPDGAGIPMLIKLAQDPAISGLGIGDFALRPLAQVALQYPQAADALVELARANQVPPKAWPTVAASLSGVYIQYGQQIFGSTASSVTWSQEQIQQRIDLIDKLIAVTSNPAGNQALQNTRASLVTRLSN